MADEPEKTLVSDKEMEAVEAEIKSKQAEEMKKISEDQAKVIEDKVRKEYQEKSEKEKLQKELEALKESDKKAKEEMEAKLKAQQEAFEKRLEELEGQRKGVASSDNPFKSKEDTLDLQFQRKLPDGKVVDVRDPKVMAEIEEASRKAWLKHTGIGDDSWGKPQ
jgi:FKBP-type peptidyl-prolyl cis-trans isomerase